MKFDVTIRVDLGPEYDEKPLEDADGVSILVPSVNTLMEAAQSDDAKFVSTAAVTPSSPPALGDRA